jgi:hypothetical protein
MTQPNILQSTCEFIKKSLVGEVLDTKNYDRHFATYIVTDVRYRVHGVKKFIIEGYDIQANKTSFIADLAEAKILCLVRTNIVVDNDVIFKVIK